MRASLISCVLLALLFTEPLWAETREETMGNLLSSGDPSNTLVSAEFARVSDGKVLFSLNPQNALIPASTMKLVLSATLLAKLSPSFRMQTRFFRTGPLKSGVVQGDLVVVGGGDPFLVSEELFLIASQLRVLGFREFSGDLVVDNSLFANDVDNADRARGQNFTTHAYDAPISALGVNFNTIAIAIAPGRRVGDQAVVSLEPFPLKGVTVENKVRTVKGASALRIERKTLPDGHIHITALGAVQVGSDLQHFYRSAASSALLAGEYIHSFLHALGISVRGKVRAGRLNKDATLVLAHDSKSVAELVHSLNQYSSNYMADVLLKRLVADDAHPGSFSEGTRVLGDFLRQAGASGTFALKDGSGLSFETRLSADQLIKVLLYAANDFRIFPDFLASLPSGGETGTLKERFNVEGASILKGAVRAKTGTLTEPVSVSALAGYLQHPTYGLLAFAILQNGRDSRPQPGIADLHVSQEKALAFFAKNFRGNDHGL